MSQTNKVKGNGGGRDDEDDNAVNEQQMQWMASSNSALNMGRGHGLGGNPSVINELYAKKLSLMKVSIVYFCSISIDCHLYLAF